MNFKEELHNTSRLLADMVSDAVMETPALLHETLDAIEKEKHPYPMRISRVIWIIAEQQPKLLQPFFERIFTMALSTNDSSVRRNFLGVLLYQWEWLTEEQLGKLVDQCFEWMENAKQPPAIKALSMKILAKSAKTYPELAPELISYLDNLSETFTTGVQATARNTMKQMQALVYKR